MKTTPPPPVRRGAPNLVNWLNDLREWAITRQVDSQGVRGWTQSPTGQKPPNTAQKTPAETYSLFGTVAGDVAKITFGFANGGDIPITMAGLPLDNDPPPTLPATGAEFELLLRAEWVPDFSGQSPQFVPDGVASWVSYEIVAGDGTAPADVAPQVTPETGAVIQNGISHFVVARWTEKNGTLSLSGRNHGNRAVIVCGVNEMRWPWAGQ